MKNLISLKILIPIMCSVVGCSSDDDPAPQVLQNDYDFNVYYTLNYSIDTFGNTYAYYKDYMLLPDGTIYADVKQVYQEINLDEFQRENPTKSGTWQEDGDTIVVKFGTKESIWETWYEAIPATSGETLDATYKSLLATTVKDAEHLTFSPDGSYTFTGNRHDTLQSGTYHLDGYGLYLEPEGGPHQNYAFFFMSKDGQKNQDAIMINGDNWSLLKNP